MMIDYEELYKILFHAITEAIDSLEKQDYAPALKRLIQAQQLTEEIYIQTDETASMINLFCDK
ncbi:MAG: hypothetical protein AAGU74_09480 [Bacillota bacterium]